MRPYHEDKFRSCPSPSWSSPSHLVVLASRPAQVTPPAPPADALLTLFVTPAHESVSHYTLCRQLLDFWQELLQHSLLLVPPPQQWYGWYRLVVRRQVRPGVPPPQHTYVVVLYSNSAPEGTTLGYIHRPFKARGKEDNRL